jgi:hypothetical protein
MILNFKKKLFQSHCKSLSSNMTEADVPITVNYLVILIIKSLPLQKTVRTEMGMTNTNEGITTISVNGNLINNSTLI